MKNIYIVTHFGLNNYSNSVYTIQIRALNFKFGPIVIEVIQNY